MGWARELTHKITYRGPIHPAELGLPLWDLGG